MLSTTENQIMRERTLVRGMDIVRRYCLFCRVALTGKNATNEHVMPQWVLRELGIADRIISPAGWHRDRVPVRRTHSWSRLVISDVCENCNSGWLSDLENRAKRIIPSLANAERALTVLLDDENILLARWAVKTAFLLQRTAGIPAIVPIDTFYALAQQPSVLPPGTFAFAFQDDGEHSAPINGLQTQDWTVHTPYENAISVTGLIRSTCKISIRIGRLHLLIAYFGSTGLEPVGWHRVHHPLFPRRCPFWIDAGFKIDRVMPRRESSMVLVHVALGAALNCTPDQIAAKASPALDQLHEEFFEKYSQLDEATIA